MSLSALSAPPSIAACLGEIPRILAIDPEKLHLEQVFTGKSNLSYVGKLDIADKRLKITQTMPVFVKQINRNAVAQICESISIFSSKNILRPIGLVQVSGKPSAVFPLCAGGNLKSFIAASSDLSPTDRLWLALQVCNALLELHAQSCVFGNLTPRTVLIRGGHDPVLMHPACVTPVPARKGAFCAPEVHQGQVPSPASDAFALGLLLAYIATGRRPFPEQPAEAVIRSILAGEAPKVPRASPLLPVITGLVRLRVEERMPLSIAAQMLSVALARPDAPGADAQEARVAELEESVAGMVSAIDALNKENRRLTENNNKLTKSIRLLVKKRKDMQKEIQDLRMAADAPSDPPPASCDDRASLADLARIDSPEQHERKEKLDRMIYELKARVEMIEDTTKDSKSGSAKRGLKRNSSSRVGAVNLSIPSLRSTGKKSSRPNIASQSALPPIPLQPEETSISKLFTVFSGNKLPAFLGALMKRRVHKFNRVHFSEPLALKGVPVEEFGSLSIAVSKNGVLGFFSWSSLKLYLYNLFDERCCVVEGFAEFAFVAFHADRVYVGELKSDVLLHATVPELFAKPALATFKRMRIPRIKSVAACTDRTIFTGEILYNSAQQLVKLNLKTGEFTEMFISGGINYIASTTSITIPGVRVVVDMDDGEKVAKIMNGEVEKIPFGYTESSVLAVIPSDRNPEDLTRSAWIDHSRNLHFLDKYAPLSKPVCPLPWHALVRVHRDAFILFDETSSRWVACRIWVD
eukprot:gnl/Chilomastix_cuspidata/2229.p1 GENE.gnl/Chilomastix_cuspidata/2229~~gnl/Chilomastix_cuspidata/2229.p1  ORF type:complete len:751 (+),score=301.72 gnl/Chilomastix_cuspidata/2229:37-2289(+)